MKKFLIALLITVTALAAALPMAEAKRMGGGGSFGKQSSYSRQNSATPTAPVNAARPAAPAAAPAAAPGAAAAKPASPWRNIVGGALLGLGVGALLSHFGMGGAFGGMLSTLLMVALLAFAVMFIFRMLSRKNASATSDQFSDTPAYSGGTASNASSTPEIGSQIHALQAQPSGLSAGGFGSGAQAGSGAGVTVALGIPADFDVTGFVRDAKSYFIRLQMAWDKANVSDIREFTTAELFAELRLQIQERGGNPNVTDVVQLNGELLGIESAGEEYLATIRFTGLIKEAADASAEPFTELWTLSKPLHGAGGWVLAGIQQVS